jgi:O-acetyl-ADP-ribose deacetylase (regulator of RNase III)
MEKNNEQNQELVVNYTQEHGNALHTDPTKKTIIAHVVNNEGLWGAGIVVAISRKWKQPEAMYRKLCKKIDKEVLKQGTVQFVDVAPNVTVCNMFAMDGVASEANPQPLIYNSLFTCLKSLRMKAERDNVEVIQMPKIGSGLARGSWSVIRKLIKLAFNKSPIRIIIRTL